MCCMVQWLAFDIFKLHVHVPDSALLTATSQFHKLGHCKLACWFMMNLYSGIFIHELHWHSSYLFLSVSHSLSLSISRCSIYQFSPLCISPYSLSMLSLSIDIYNLSLYLSPSSLSLCLSLSLNPSGSMSMAECRI